MRQIVLDTETTGLSTAEGHRVIEIGCVEMVNRKLTGEHFHRYINPERDIDEGALEVHGISLEFLQDKPRFVDLVDEFMAFVKDAELIIHNAPFDLGFLDYELSLLDDHQGKMRESCKVLDTLLLAREIHPGQKNNLDALCKRYDVNNSQRELHGALLDAEILADVYLAMTGGQADLLFADQVDAPQERTQRQKQRQQRPALKVVTATEQELALHQQQLDLLDKASDGNCVWRKQQADQPS